MATHTDESGGIGATRHSFRILEALRDLEGGRVSEVAAHLDIPTSTVHSHLSTLYDLEYVTKEGDEYYLAARFLELGRNAVTRNPVYPAFEDVLTELADETQERAQFCIEEHGLGVFLHDEKGEHGISTSTPIGARRHLHQTAVGKAILAYLPEPRVEEILDRRGLPAATENTITDRETLLAELAEIRDREYAYNREEYIEGVNAVGVPIQDKYDRVAGAIGVAGPAHRLNGEVLESEYPKKMLGVVNEMEINLKYLG